MKKTLLLLLLLIGALNQVFSQDIIIKRNGDEIQGKVREISPSEIRYTRQDQPEVTMVLPTDLIFMIKYENGSKEIFHDAPAATGLQQLPTAPAGNTRPAPAVATDNTSNHDLYVKGRSDASLYYKGYKGAGTATLVTTLLFPPAGLITAIGTSLTPPSRNNLDYPNANLYAQPEYARGYSQKSKSIKSGKVWKNFGIGFGSLVLLQIILNAGSDQ